MRRYIIKRLLWLIPVMALISFITFSLMYLSPGDPAEIFLSQGGDAPDPEAVEQLRTQLGLNDSLPVQYGKWIGNLLHGDLGTSIFTGNSVSHEIQTYFPNTLKLTILATVLTLAISIPLGILTAVRENGILDNIVRIFNFIFGSFPGFFAALLLIYFLGVKLRWLPTISTGSSKGIWMPAITLTLTMAPGYIRQIRAAVSKELGEEYIRMMRARGIREYSILFLSVLKSILPSLFTIIGINVGHLLGGTAIIEIVCTYPGLGRLAVESITNRDYPLMQGFVLMMAGIYVLVNLAVDILCSLTDPKIRRSMIEEKGGEYCAAKKKRSV